MGPYSAPTPSEVEEERGEPMAVARDKTTDQQSFVPTTASQDAFAPEVAEKYGAPGGARGAMAASHEANRAAEDPPGYTKVNEHGFKRPSAEEIEEEY